MEQRTSSADIDTQGRDSLPCSQCQRALEKERAILMGMYDGFLPKVHDEGKCGYYPVSNAQEWEELPAVYKAMEWFPIEMKRHGYTEKTVAEYVEFDVTYMTPYKINAVVRVHVQEVQKILFCLFKDPQCLLYSVCGVVFQNGERWGAKWYQDSRTGAYAITCGGTTVGKQGGYLGFIPSNIERTEDGGWRHHWNPCKNRCHYQLMNPFE